jgi:hypothetical protein
LREKLHNLAQPLELCDDSGRVLAHLMPICNPAAQSSLEPPTPEEKQLQREKLDKWLTTELVWAHLNSLEEN